MKFNHIISAICLVGVVSLTGCGNSGNGEKIGTVVNVNEASGYFCPTMEVEVQRGGMSGGTGVVGAVFHGTVEGDKAMFEKLRKAMETRQEVKITYRKEVATFCRSGSHDNSFITSVEFFNAAEHDAPVAVNITAPVAVVAAASGAQAPVRETHNQKVARLLKVQAELINELAAEKQ